ncbi:MAG TPA: glycosyltransferase [Ktedonobacterales bacterium]|jgi:glycosyltransferase involved in cell wall biosynthesis|nr:glycosyltransferase [Ktedonobacterales bacterium]
MQVALVHDYLNQMGGAEKVLLTLHELYPQAPIHTSIFDPKRVDRRFSSMDIRTSFMQRLPFVKRYHQPFLPLYPYAFERTDLRWYDLVISDSSAFAKGVVTRPDALHICYCHTPMRWAWNYDDYIDREDIGNPLTRRALIPFISWLRSWDYTTAARVDYFVANSPAVAARIAKYYRREAVVIPPPVDTSRFYLSPQHEDYFLIVSRLIPYKAIDIAVKAFTMTGAPLRIIGSGRDERRLRRMAGPNVKFLGRLSDDEVRSQLARCRALIFAGEEDFGITPVEAQASGRPVIAYGAGGALATIIEGSTGLFFYEQTPEALAEVVNSFRDEYFDPQAIRRHAEEFDTRRFLRRFTQFVETRIASHPTLARKAGLEYSGPELQAFGDLSADTPDNNPARLRKTPTLFNEPLPRE